MNYTLVTMEEVHGNDFIGIDADGNKYSVYLGHKEEGMDTIFSSRKFDTLLEAYAIYEKLASFFVFGLYSYKERKSFLLTGTVD